MNTIELKVNVQLDFSEETKQFIAAILVPHCTCNPVTSSTLGLVNEQPADEPTPAKPADEPTPADTPAPATKSPITIEDVRKALQEKVNEHRETIKTKLTELGSPNVTKLDPEKYEEMFNFLKDLD